jgi:RsiW-degrading membrane proteinase PrsW (M82 family)
VVIAFYIFLSFFFPFLWIFYFYKKDKHPEPVFWLIIAFLLGISSAFISYYFQKNTVHFLKDDWQRYLIFAFIEEFFKFFLIWLFVFPQKVFDEPIDAMIYMMFSALGFAFFENLILSIDPKVQCLDLILSINPEVQCRVLILIFRFLGANLLHILASSLIGYGYAFFVKTRRIFPLALSFLSGTFLHFLYNYFIISLLIIGLPPRYILVLLLPILWTTFLVVLSELNYLARND